MNGTKQSKKSGRTGIIFITRYFLFYPPHCKKDEITVGILRERYEYCKSRIVSFERHHRNGMRSFLEIQLVDSEDHERPFSPEKRNVFARSFAILLLVARSAPRGKMIDFTA